MPAPTQQRRRGFQARRRLARSVVVFVLVGLAVSQSPALARRATTWLRVPAAGATVGPRGSVQVLHLRRDGRSSDVWVYRPGVADSASLPVLYFLHGLPGKASDVFRAGLAASMDRYIAAGGLPFVVAAADGTSPIHADTEWGNASDGSDDLETFLTTTVISAVEGDHPRAAAQRAIAGFSMGGYGAVNLAERHPDLFGQVVSVAGYFKVDDPSQMFATPSAQAANTPTRNVARLTGKRILLLEATQEDESLIRGQALSFRRLLAAAGIPAKLIRAEGTHGWAYVASQLPTIERFLAAGWRSPSQT